MSCSSISVKSHETDNRSPSLAMKEPGEVQGVRNESLMRRFLVGDATDEERDMVERAFMEDGAFFESLCALEHEMIVQYVRNELPAEWRERFKSSIEASPARAARVRE